MIVTYRSKDFTRLLQTIKLFWDPSKCDQQIKMELISIRRFTSRLQKLLLWSNVLCIVLVMSFPLLQNKFPTGIWTMEGYAVLYRCVMIGQTIIVPLSALSLCALDCMYLGLCTEIVIQFRMLSHYLQKLKSEDSIIDEMEINQLNQIKSLVRLFFRFVKEFRRAFSLVLLIEFVVDGPLICAELLAGFESTLQVFMIKDDHNIRNCKFVCFSPSYQAQARHVIVFIFVNLQLAFFCISANYITNEALAVSDAVYFSNWYSQHIPSLKVPLLLIIQNSQNEIAIKGGGLVTINAGTIVN
ncbi:hypothetical protein ILUMI_13542, partial [Ignelater luminosus]